MIEKKKTEFEMLLENLEYVVFEDKVFLSAASKRSLGLTFSSSLQETYKKGIEDCIEDCIEVCDNNYNASFEQFTNIEKIDDTAHYESKMIASAEIKHQLQQLLKLKG